MARSVDFIYRPASYKGHPDFELGKGVQHLAHEVPLADALRRFRAIDWVAETADLLTIIEAQPRFTVLDIVEPGIILHREVPYAELSLSTYDGVHFDMLYDSDAARLPAPIAGHGLSSEQVVQLLEDFYQERYDDIPTVQGALPQGMSSIQALLESRWEAQRKAQLRAGLIQMAIGIGMLLLLYLVLK